MKRRHFLQASLGLALAAALPYPSRAESVRLPSVQVAADRVTRIIVGLRPYRTTGFRVATQKLDDRLIVHNYGHGGAGLTLSWGTSELAVQLAWSDDRNYAVLGAGAVGLATARLLQQRGARVTIYARDLPPHTTSNIAGGQWAPVSVSDRDKRTPAFNEQLSRAAQLSFNAFQELLGSEYGVHWAPNYFVKEQRPDGHEIFPQARDVAILSPEECPFQGRYAIRLTTMMIDVPRYLRRVMDDFLLHGGKVVVRELTSLDAVARLPHRTIINCTGLGSRDLFSDPDLIPLKGQLSVLLPQPEIDYAALAEHLYMFSRPDGILLGGTFERGISDLAPNQAAAARILEGHQRLFSLLRS